MIRTNLPLARLLTFSVREFRPQCVRSHEPSDAEKDPGLQAAHSEEADAPGLGGKVVFVVCAVFAGWGGAQRVIHDNGWHAS